MDIKDILCDDKQTVIECLTDYASLLAAGLSIKFPLLGERTHLINAVGDLLAKLTQGEEDTRGDTRADRRRHDYIAGSSDEGRDESAEHRGANRGYISEGIDPAHRGDTARRQEIPSPVGIPQDVSPQDDGETDDRGEGA